MTARRETRPGSTVQLSSLPKFAIREAGIGFSKRSRQAGGRIKSDTPHRDSRCEVPFFFMGRLLLKDEDWAVVEDQVCLVTDFTPMANIDNGRIVFVNGGIPAFRGPYAWVWLRSESGEEMTGVINHELDFMMLWAAFNHHIKVRECRMDIAPQTSTLESTDDFRPEWMKQAVARFQAYYARVLNEGGHKKLQPVLEAHRESLNSLEPEERAAIANIIFQAQATLPEPEEVWLTWTRNRYRKGVRRALFRRFLPRLVVRVARRGVFEALRMPLVRRRVATDTAYAARAVPLITWTPEMMERRVSRPRSSTVRE